MPKSKRLYIAIAVVLVVALVLILSRDDVAVTTNGALEAAVDRESPGQATRGPSIEDTQIARDAIVRQTEAHSAEALDGPATLQTQPAPSEDDTVESNEFDVEIKGVFGSYLSTEDAEKFAEEVIDALDAFLVAVNTGDAELIESLTTQTGGVSNQLDGFQALISDSDEITMDVYNDNVQALAVSSPVGLEGQLEDSWGYLVFTLGNFKSHWRIDDIDYETFEGAEDEIERFLNDNPLAGPR